MELCIIMMTMINQKFLWIIIFVISLFTVTSCNTKPSTNTDGEISDIQSAKAVMQEFLDFEMKGNADKIREMEHYENDWEADFKYNEILGSPAPIKSYQILSSEKINDSLFVFQIEAETVYSDSPDTFYNFVIVLDGEYRAVCNIRNIPEKLFEGEDLSMYSNETPWSLDVEDVMIFSED